MRELGCFCFVDTLGGPWALLGVALQGLSQGTDFVLFSWLLLWMLCTFQRMLFYSLINGLLVVRVIAVVHARVDLAVDVTRHLWSTAGLDFWWYCCGLSDVEIRHRAGRPRVWGWSGFRGIAVWAGV